MKLRNRNVTKYHKIGLACHIGTPAIIESCEKDGDIMSNNSKKDGIVVLGGREFKRVKNGLDEVQVASFIDELTKERDKLPKSQDHIASLNRLVDWYSRHY